MAALVKNMFKTIIKTIIRKFEIEFDEIFSFGADVSNYKFRLSW